MRRRISCSSAALALAALLILAGGAPARAAAGPTSTGSYDCQLDGTGSASVQATVQLAAMPAQVEPGQRLSIGGTVSFTFDQGQSILSDLLLAQHAWIGALDFSIIASASGTSTTLTPNSVTSPKTATATPLTVPVKAAWGDYTVPANTHEVDLALPHADTIDDPLDPVSAIGVPAKVAFTATIDTDGLAPQRTMVCWVPDGEQPPPLARILVSAPESAPPAPATPSGGPAPAVQPAHASGTATSAAAGTAAKPTDPGAAEPTGATASASATAAPVYAAVPASTRTSTVFIPEWALATAGLLLLAALVAYDVLLHRRVTSTRTRIAQERSKL